MIHTSLTLIFPLAELTMPLRTIGTLPCAARLKSTWERSKAAMNPTFDTRTMDDSTSWMISKECSARSEEKKILAAQSEVIENRESLVQRRKSSIILKCLPWACHHPTCHTACLLCRILVCHTQECIILICLCHPTHTESPWSSLQLPLLLPRRR